MELVLLHGLRHAIAIETRRRFASSQLGVRWMILARHRCGRHNQLVLLVEMGIGMGMGMGMWLLRYLSKWKRSGQSSLR